MLHQLSNLIGYTIRASDGELGAVQDVYFDDRDWTIRYFVVDTGDWLPGRLVLVSTDSVRGVNVEDEALTVDLDMAQVESSPDIQEHEPVSRQHELQVRTYYGWPVYWAQGAEATRSLEAIRKNALADRPDESHLQSVRDVAAYFIHATDGDLGYAQEYLYDDVNWMIRYLVVDASDVVGGRSVLIPPDWVVDFDWNQSQARIAHTREEVRNSPFYDPTRSPEREEEAQLYAHYDQPPYWD